MLWSLTDSESYSEIESKINYKPLKNTGVKILIRGYRLKDENKFEFDLHKEDISMKDYVWSIIWGKNFGYYLDGVNPKNKNLNCPYISEEEQLPGSDIKEISSEMHQVTLVLNQELIEAIVLNRCAVSPKPRRAPDYERNNSTPSSHSIFPTINN